ncbi:NADH ubiquinone oxidoreductase 20 kDa subunit [Acidithiobacillus ferrivorans SS3]|uniref:NADH ubiquinone oxidoreductase 20 kDa subunit n=1 Tax=Acidithiobacillus ferrivorans SS3 TaxID=743299 RepID=G0JPS4_9PROT|nr:NADH-quinone oxidoreductase subunit NuoB [Acidithiobacillus ferrivorans]AEM47399.1 NADH ubiquinone oxidoreductase 20 kDa subunit [Acidithiobacillus ferrivorans SS3]OFA17318.1 hydrogenase [Acidithiobacillus ferrivorans]
MYRILRAALRLGKVGETPPRTKRDPSSASPSGFHHSLSIRHVDAGSCNGCELELNALNGPHYGLEQAGFRFTASPRHADVLTVSGPVTRHMVAALQDCHNAMPEPRKVIAIGDCAGCGGVFQGSYAVMGGVAEVLPVDLQIPGCPPDPDALLRGLLQVSGERIER